MKDWHIEMTVSFVVNHDSDIGQIVDWAADRLMDAVADREPVITVKVETFKDQRELYRLGG
jgi:hypothetical protein